MSRRVDDDHTNGKAARGDRPRRAFDQASGPGSGRRVRIACVLFGASLMGTSCSIKYALRTTQPPAGLQWPYQPEKAKVTYVESFTGLASQRGGGSLLRNIVFGSEGNEQNAFLLPVAVATGQDGRIAVADMGRSCVHLYLRRERSYQRLCGSQDEKMVSPVALAFDDASRLYVSDSSGKVFAFGPDGSKLFVLHEAGESRLLRPTGLAYNPRRKLLYVVDTLAHKVYAFSPNGDLAFSFGGHGQGLGEFNFPTHIFCARTGELYVTDALNFRIQIFDDDGEPLGSFGRQGDGSGDLALPKGIAVDGSGTVYVVDGLFDNVQLFDRRGDFLLTVGRRGTDFGEFWLPSGAFISDEDELYVCDTYNRRVQVFKIAQQHSDDAS